MLLLMMMLRYPWFLSLTRDEKQQGPEGKQTQEDKQDGGQPVMGGWVGLRSACGLAWWGLCVCDGGGKPSKKKSPVDDFRSFLMTTHHPQQTGQSFLCIKPKYATTVAQQKQGQPLGKELASEPRPEPGEMLARGQKR